MKIFKFFANFILALSLFIPALSAYAQDQSPTYIVQDGDTLSIIAQRFGVSVNDLISANNIQDPNAISSGTELIIPGLTGITGVLMTVKVHLGEDLDSLSQKYQLPAETLIKLNRITSPNEVYAGSSLIIPKKDNQPALTPISLYGSEDSLLETAARTGQNYWSIQNLNNLSSSWSTLPGTIIYAPSSSTGQQVSSVSPLIKQVTISPLPLIQGKTTIIRISTTQPLDFQGDLGGHPLHFFEIGSNEYVALQGIHALADPGLIPLSIQGSEGSTIALNYQGNLLLESGLYPKDPPLIVDPRGLDKSLTQPEDDWLFKTTAPADPIKAWTVPFQYPVDKPCVKSWFGDRRSYNGSDYIYFHTGLDFGVCANLNAYAVAPGKVIFAGPLTVRGNVVIIDHGWGVYSGYWHLKQPLVNSGDIVRAGQQIGIIGDTGLRVTGPHLHLEIIVNGVQVDPFDWLEKTVP